MSTEPEQTKTYIDAQHYGVRAEVDSDLNALSRKVDAAVENLRERDRYLDRRLDFQADDGDKLATLVNKLAVYLLALYVVVIVQLAIIVGLVCRAEGLW